MKKSIWLHFTLQLCWCITCEKNKIVISSNETSGFYVFLKENKNSSSIVAKLFAALFLISEGLDVSLERMVYNNKIYLI